MEWKRIIFDEINIFSNSISSIDMIYQSGGEYGAERGLILYKEFLDLSHGSTTENREVGVAQTFIITLLKK